MRRPSYDDLFDKAKHWRFTSGYSQRARKRQFQIQGEKTHTFRPPQRWVSAARVSLLACPSGQKRLQEIFPRRTNHTQKAKQPEKLDDPNGDPEAKRIQSPQWKWLMMYAGFLLVLMPWFLGHDVDFVFLLPGLEWLRRI